MRLNAPKKFTFWSSLVIFVVGIVSAFGVVPFIPGYIGVIAAIVGYGLLFLGNLLKGFLAIAWGQEDEGETPSSFFCAKKHPLCFLQRVSCCTLRAF